MVIEDGNLFRENPVFPLDAKHRSGPQPPETTQCYSRKALRASKIEIGTNADNFETLTVFGHRGDIPLTEFLYHLEVCPRIHIFK